MDSSSDEDSGFVRRKSASKKVLDSDDENDDIEADNKIETTEDFKLHFSDEDDDGDTIGARIAASLAAGSDDSSDSSCAKSVESSIKPTNTSSDVSLKADDVTLQHTGNQKVSQTAGFQGTEAIMRKLSALADSDSESDEDCTSLQPKTKTKLAATSGTLESDSDGETSELHDHNPSAQSFKSMKENCGPERKSKTKAKNAMLEIKAESQRQLRQSKIGLPYHIPKQRSLLDFLNRRKSSSPMPIKGPVEQLAPVWKQIEEREKEVEQFYKSESEDESDADDSMCAPSANQHDNKLDSVNPNQKEEELRDQVNITKSSEQAKQLGDNADNIKITEKQPTSVPVVATEPFNQDISPGVDNSTVHSHESEKNDLKIIKSASETIISEKSENAFSVEIQKIVDENSSPECRLPEPILGEGGTSLQESCNSAVIDLGNREHEVFENPSLSKIQENDRTLIASVDNFQSDVHTQESQNISLCLKETPTLLLTNNVMDDQVLNVPKECRLKNHEPLKFNDQKAVATHWQSSTQDSQDISLHYSETQNPLDNGAKQSFILEDKATCQREEGTEENTDKGRKLTWEELDAAIRNDDHSDSEDTHVKKVLPNKRLTSTGPRLSLKCDPSGVIDLDDMSPGNSAGVKGLIERFMKHSAPKKKPTLARTVELSVISSDKDASGDVVDVKQESVKIFLNGDDDYRSDNNHTPGARLKLLKNELNKQMRKQKEEEWHKRLEEMKNEKYFDGERDVCDGLPEEDEEEEMTDSEAESEPEINDVREPRQKRKPKSLFLDEEAEVEDEGNGSGADEDTQIQDEEDEGDSVVDDNECEESDEEDDTEDNASIINSGINSKQKNMPGNLGDESIVYGHQERAGGSLQRTMTSVSDLFASQSNEWQNPADDDDFIPPGQPNGVRSDQFSQRSEDPKDSAIFMSPCLSIPRKSSSSMQANHELTPLKCFSPIEIKSPSMKQLFSEAEPESTQEKFAELANLFGDKFKDSQDSIPTLTNTSLTSEPDTDLMALCSGKFLTQVPEPKELEKECTQPFRSQGSQFSSQMSIADESYVDAEDSVDFSLKFDGDVKSSEDAKDDFLQTKESFRLEILSSDEEEPTLLEERKKKKKQRLQFSDDEEEADEEDDLKSLGSDLSEAEDEGEAPSNKDAKLFGVFTKSSKEVFYDSDENEIEASDFLEKEAELSEEEDWRGSEDEDEKGLDQLEMDEADKEDIDQDLVREQLLQNHMQKMLDEDRRDVRILQEMLLEDGELHSDTGGRERQFRWRNVDSSGMGDNKHPSDDERADQEEEEDDADWRKQRYEREIFLREQREKQKKEADNPEDDEVLENSELLQLGKSVLLKFRSSSMDTSSGKDPQPSKIPTNAQILSPDGKRPNVFLSKRGSFLSRGDNVLAKLAKISGSAKENVLAGAKNSGNFVFTSRSPSKKESQPDEDLDSKSSKRKAAVGLLNSTEKKQCLFVPSKKRSGLFDHL